MWIGAISLLASNYKFPHYDICSDELDRIANGSPIARICLETGYARISEIPKELMAEDAGEERAKWLEDKLLNIIKEISEKDEKNILIAGLGHVAEERRTEEGVGGSGGLEETIPKLKKKETTNDRSHL